MGRGGKDVLAQRGLVEQIKAHVAGGRHAEADTPWQKSLLLSIRRSLRAVTLTVQPLHRETGDGKA